MPFLELLTPMPRTQTSRFILTIFTEIFHQLPNWLHQTHKAQILYKLFSISRYYINELFLKYICYIKLFLYTWFFFSSQSLALYISLYPLTHSHSLYYFSLLSLHYFIHLFLNLLSPYLHLLTLSINFHFLSTFSLKPSYFLTLLIPPFSPFFF